MALMNPNSSFVQEMTAFIPTLRAFGRSLCMNVTLADDLVQETMLRAWNNRAKFQPGSNMKAWLLTVLRNQYYSELRYKKFEVEDPDGQYAAGLSAQPKHEAELELEELARALRTLPDERREALLLVCADGLSYKQAAEICNCAVGTIKSRIARGRDHLTATLGGKIRSRDYLRPEGMGPNSRSPADLPNELWLSH